MESTGKVLIAGALHSVDTTHIVAYTGDLYDVELEEKQSTINSSLRNELTRTTVTATTANNCVSALDSLYTNLNKRVGILQKIVDPNNNYIDENDNITFNEFPHTFMTPEEYNDLEEKEEDMTYFLYDDGTGGIIPDTPVIPDNPTNPDTPDNPTPSDSNVVLNGTTLSQFGLLTNASLLLNGILDTAVLNLTIGTNQPSEPEEELPEDLPSEDDTLDLNVLKIEVDHETLLGLSSFDFLPKSISGLDKDVLVTVSDRTGLWFLADDLSEPTKPDSMVNLDLEGVTVDTTTGDIYGSCERDHEELTENGCSIIKWNKNEEYSVGHVYATIPNVMRETNKGLEAIVYYRTVDGEPLFLVAVLKKPITLMLWSKSKGVIAQITNAYTGDEQLGGIPINEIADMHWDGQYLWIIDSHDFNIHKWTLSILDTDITISQVMQKSIAPPVDKTTTEYVINTRTDEPGENPEALYLNDDYIYIGCDLGSTTKYIIYKIKRDYFLS